MKLKHINIVERFFERGVFAVAALFFLWVLWAYFLSGPYNVRTGPDDFHGPADHVEEVLSLKATTLQMQVKSSSPKFSLTTVLPYTEDFRRRYNHSLMDVASFDLPFGQPGLDKDVFIFVTPPPPHYDLPTLPVPAMVKTYSDHYVLGDVSDNPAGKAYDTLIGAQQPRDFRAVTVWATYDMKKLEDNYANTPNDRRIPANFVRNALYFTDVTLERQTLDPGTGQWGDLTIIEHLPGVRDYSNTPPDLAPTAANQIKEEIRLEQDQIARPDFAPVDPIHPWNPPASADSAANPGAPAPIRIWAHDLTVQPGSTYRYRMSVSVLDPLYRVANLDPGQREAYYNALSLPASNPSSWSAPVTVDQANYFYLVGANKGQGTAKIEVWHVFNGAWNRVEFEVQPGDMISKTVKKAVGGTTYNVNFRPNSTMVVDIDFNAQSIKAGETNNVALVVLNNATGKIQTRTLEEDADDLTRSRLRQEAGAAGPVVAKP